MFTRLFRWVVLMAIALPMLRITDGTLKVDFLNDRQLGGYHLLSYAPTYPDVKGGGIYQDSPLTPGRQLVMRTLANVIETFQLVSSGHRQDLIVRDQQILERLLRQAVEYWTTTWRSQVAKPVWIEARGAHETGARYAVVHDWRVTDMKNLYQPPMDSHVPATDFNLTLEHGIWQGNPPGEGTCVQVSGQKHWDPNTAPSVWSGAILAESDDAYYMGGTGSLILAGGINIGGPYTVGLRFQNVNVPPGSTITRAYFYVDKVISSVDVSDVQIYGELDPTPATYTTAKDFARRMNLTSINSVNWLIAPWVAGGQVPSPDITNIVQELVNFPGWAAMQQMSFFWFTNDDMVTWHQMNDFGVPLPAVLVIWYTPPTNFGRAATCLPSEVFVANRETTAQLTALHHYDLSANVWSANRIGGALPYTLLPAVPAVGDFVVFGVRQDLPDAGPFGSLVFDTSVVANDITVTYELWTGAAWTITSTSDHTGNTHPWEWTGVYSMHWGQPTNWVPHNLFTVYGAGAPNYVAWWYRIRVTAVGGAPAPATQANRNVYTIVRGSVSIAASQVPGVEPALTEIILRHVSAKMYQVYGGVKTWTSRLMAAARSDERGDNFSAYINLCNRQNPAGVSAHHMGDVTEILYSRAAAGYCHWYQPTVGVGTWLSTSSISFDQIAGLAYRGTYRCFLRVYQYAGATGNLEFRLKAITRGNTIQFSSLTAVPTLAQTPFPLDLGVIELPPLGDLTDVDELDSMVLSVQCRNTDGTYVAKAYLYDVILMPIDEWAVDMVADIYADIPESLAYGEEVVIDSLRRPKSILRTYFRDVATGQWQARLRDISNGPAVLKPNEDQHLWFFAMQYDESTGMWAANPILSHTVSVNATARYLLNRGAG